MLLKSQRKRDIQSIHLRNTVADSRIGNYKGSFDDWLARLPFQLHC